MQYDDLPTALREEIGRLGYFQGHSPLAQRAIEEAAVLAYTGVRSAEDRQGEPEAAFRCADPDCWDWRTPVEMPHEHKPRSFPPPTDVRVIIAGDYPDVDYEHRTGGDDNNRTWLARRYRPEMRDIQGRPVYTILGKTGEADPTAAWLRIPGLHDARNEDPNACGMWFMHRKHDYRGRRVYEVTGDPSSVAVGRFKASLRKFLGVE
jgi:hypothetical protein